MKNSNYDFKDEIKKQIEESILSKEEIICNCTDIINDIAGEIIESCKKNKKILWFGNGGSAADAQHLACELVSKFRLERKAIPSMALTVNTSILTAISNDYGYDNVFERQVEAFAEEADVLIGITTSGTSLNVIRGLELGRKKGAITVAFTGKNADRLKGIVDYLVPIPSDNTPRIQEAHIMVGHIICHLVEEELFGDERITRKWETAPISESI